MRGRRAKPLTQDVKFGDSEAQLFLGFDSSCSTCSDIARRVQSDVGSAVDVLPLNNAHMAGWRKEVFGENAPWLPTLIRVSGGHVEGWTGWKIGPVLGKALGPTKTWQVLANIGDRQLDTRNSAQEAIEGNSFGVAKSRRKFMKIAAVTVGAFAGAGMLVGRAAPALASPGSGNLVGNGERTLDGAELAETVKSQLESVDAVNVLQSASPTLRDRSNSIRQSPLANDEELERGGRAVSLDGGVEMKWTYIYSPTDSLAVYTQDFSSPVGDVSSASHLVKIDDRTGDAKDASFQILLSSINGEVPTPIPQDADISRAADPCGGCNGICQITGSKLRSSCRVESQLGCILGAAGCALCVTCSGTVVCVGCVVTSCGGAVLSCCGQSEPACHRCTRVC